MKSRHLSAVLAVTMAALPCACDDDKTPDGGNPGKGGPAVPAMPRFEEIAEKAGLNFVMRYLPAEQGFIFKINLYDHGCGTAVADVDGDGRDDAFFCNQLGPCGLFRNTGTGSFTDVTKDAGELAGALDGKICVAAAFADADSDGDQDLFVTTTRGGNVFLENQGGFKFRDTTKDAGLVLVGECETPSFFDVDNDGDLDLFLTNTAKWTLDQFDQANRYYVGKSSLAELIASEKEWNVLYRNDGKGRFTDVTAEAGLKGYGWGGDVAVFDADGDGDLDLFVGNMFGASTMYTNDGKGRFTEVTRQMLGKSSWGAVGARAFDYDGDAKLDLFISDMHSDMWAPQKVAVDRIEEKKKYKSFMTRAIELKVPGFDARAEEQFVRDIGFNPDDVVFGNTLYRNLGGGKFEEVSDKAGTETFWPWGAVEGDYDADGFVDVYVPSGMGYPFIYWRSPLLRNRGDGTFVDVCKEAGIEPPPGGPETGEVIANRNVTRSSRSGATGDFDGDGRLDLLVSNFNDRAFYFHNVSAPQHWCQLRLTGTKSNRDAIGALVTLTAGGKKQVRQVQAAGGYLSQSSNALHFGLGAAGAVEKVEIRWPSGATQTIENPKIDALTKVTEPK